MKHVFPDIAALRAYLLRCADMIASEAHLDTTARERALRRGQVLAYKEIAMFLNDARFNDVGQEHKEP